MTEWNIKSIVNYMDRVETIDKMIGGILTAADMVR